MADLQACAYAQVVTIDRASDCKCLETYAASYSVMGICVELSIVVRPTGLIKTRLTSYKTTEDLPAKILEVCFYTTMHRFLHTIRRQHDLERQGSNKVLDKSGHKKS